MSTETSPQQTSSLKLGGFIAVDGKPCKILEMIRSAPGKHSSAKINFRTTDLTTGKTLMHSAPSKGTVDVPEVHRENHTVIDITDDGYMTLMGSDGAIRQDISLPDSDEGKQVRKFLDNGDYAEIVLVNILGFYYIQSVREVGAY